MRRPTRFGLAALVALSVLFGAYGAYWLIVANLIEHEIVAWAQAAHDRKLDASWQRIAVTGFPVGFRFDLDHAILRDQAVSPNPELHIPALSGVASPWRLTAWRLAMPTGLQAGLAGAGGRPWLKFAADTANGTLMIGPQGAATLWLNLRQATAEAGERVRVAAARSWIILPPTTPRSQIEPKLAVAVDLRDVQLPAPARVFSGGIEQLALGLTLKGSLPSGNLVRSIAAWRDAGGTIELDHLQLIWGGLGVTGTGTFALDRDLQPIGGFSGAIEGYDRVLRALVQAGRLHAGEAGLAQLALTLLAKTGPDGRPQIATSFTIQNGQMFLGPARLGPVPRIAWK